MDVTGVVDRADSDQVATLTLNRPEKLNAITTEMFIALPGHIDDLAADPSIGVVVLTGAGDCFGAGNDLRQTGGASPPTPHFAAETIDALEALPQITIAKVRGYCLTGSLEVALGCDLIVAGSSAEFADTHGRWGFVPVWGMSVDETAVCGAGRDVARGGSEVRTVAALWHAARHGDSGTASFRLLATASGDRRPARR